MVTLVTLLGADAKFLCILVSVPYEELCVGVYGFQCSVVYVLSIPVSMEILFLFILSAVDKSHPVRVSGVFTIHKMVYNTIMSNGDFVPLHIERSSQITSSSSERDFHQSQDGVQYHYDEWRFCSSSYRAQFTNRIQFE